MDNTQTTTTIAAATTRQADKFRYSCSKQIGINLHLMQPRMKWAKMRQAQMPKIILLFSI